MSRLQVIVSRFPVLVVAPVGWVAVLLDPIQVATYLASIVVCAVALAVEVPRVNRRDRRPWRSVPGPLLFFAAIGLLRQAAGGTASGVALLALLPIFDLALYGRDRRALWVLLIAEAALYFVPVVLIGGASYPHTQYRAGVVVLMVSCVIALTTERLVGRVRREASEARRGHTMLEQVNELVHELFESRDVRADLCAGAMRISEASIAILFEPDAEAGLLRCSAVAGLTLESSEVPIDIANPIGAAFLRGRPLLWQDIDERRLAAPEVWRACGRPQVLLYQPVVRGGVTIGVLGVAWVRADADVGLRTSAVELVTHEAALVLDQADHVTRLTGMAQTDPLTGLPNRRAWDARVATALGDDRQITVALIDIDHFKAFNDRFGHPAGDRLLRESAAAWREVLRDGDVLARLGGEEFGVLLLDCGPQAALEVTERLRAAMPGAETCSAGLAARRGGEPIESVVARADEALYEAKADGRDLARTAT